MAMIAKTFQYPHLFFNKKTALSEPTPTPDRYEYLNMISKGSYGRVYREETGEIVGMKEETHGFSKSTLREINIMKSLPRHPSTVDYKDVFVDKNRGHGRDGVSGVRLEEIHGCAEEALPHTAS